MLRAADGTLLFDGTGDEILSTKFVVPELTTQTWVGTAGIDLDTIGNPNVKSDGEGEDLTWWIFDGDDKTEWEVKPKGDDEAPEGEEVYDIKTQTGSATIELTNLYSLFDQLTPGDIEDAFADAYVLDGKIEGVDGSNIDSEDYSILTAPETPAEETAAPASEPTEE